MRTRRPEVLFPTPTPSRSFTWHPGSCGAALLLGAVLLAGTVGCATTTRSNPAGDGATETDAKPLPTVTTKTAEFETHEGFLDYHVDRRGGRIWLEIPPPDDDGVALELVYLEGLTSGLGSNPVGLDRGQMGTERILRFRRVGQKVLFEQPNLSFRALSDDPAERRAVEQSFAPSVLWGAEIAALDPDGRTLVDLSSFLLRDAHDVVARLKQNDHGEFALDFGRSAVDLDAALAFRDNIELEAVLTYASPEPGTEVAQTAAAGTAFTLIQHHSFVRLPDDGYETRNFDPRMPSYGVRFLDYAAPLDAPIERAWIARHRLEKTDPTAARSTVHEPIVYYVDPGVPEPVRSALVDGASWWADAFDAAGFIDGYRVEPLPKDAHPLDVRYNVIQWVHRATRGWSYGFGITDPRTGEIIKGHVSLGSLRVRQDILLFEGLAGVSMTGTGAPDDPVELALARIRQLAAHEVGHTLGFTHNFAASTYDDRASVMDYPAPLIGIAEDGTFDFSRAYGVGIGTWDRHAVRFAYTEFAPGADEDAELDRIVREGLDDGLLFLADDDARPAGASDPRANLWDNGDDPVAELAHALEIRRLALSRFGEGNLEAGRALTQLQEVLAPVYFHHRYQLDAAAKAIGGLEYDYVLAGTDRRPSRIVSAERQRAALATILGLLEPAALDLSDAALELLVPRTWGSPPNRELFASRTAPAFDPLSAAATVAASVADQLLQPERLARLRDFHRRDPALPSPEETLGALVDRAFTLTGNETRTSEIARVVARTVTERLIAQAASPNTDPDLRALYEWALREATSTLERTGDAAGEVYRVGLTKDIRRYLNRGHATPPASWTPPPPPPGSPIGTAPAHGCSVW